MASGLVAAVRMLLACVGQLLAFLPTHGPPLLQKSAVIAAVFAASSFRLLHIIGLRQA